MGWQDEVEARIVELAHYRLHLEEVRRSARSVGGPEGQHLEEKIETTIKKLSEQINDLQAALD
jgi:hypothetical protein